MKKNFIYLFIFFILGILIMFLLLKNSALFYGTKDTQVLSYEIKRLNKLIVIEEIYKSIHKERIAPDYGISFKNDYINLTETEIAFDVTVKLQVTYNMKKLKIEVDSIHKKIHIKYIPEPEIRIFPELTVRDLNQGIFNKLSKEELNKVSDNAKKLIIKKINTQNLKNKAHKQLLDNLKDIYALAKIYNWDVVDNTGISSYDILN